LIFSHEISSLNGICDLIYSDKSPILIEFFNKLRKQIRANKHGNKKKSGKNTSASSANVLLLIVNIKAPTEKTARVIVNSVVLTELE